MATLKQAKAMAKRLRSALAAREIDLSHSATLELIAAELGYDDWNIAVAKLDDESAEQVSFLRTIPILRIFDERKAREFYCDFLGFAVEFEHRFESNLPLYMEVKRAGLHLHLSGHHGDASPGSTVFVSMTGVHALHRELTDKNYGYGRPGVERASWGDVFEVHDPFGNRIRFCEMKA